MTLIERFKLDYPDNNGYSDDDVKDCMIGCPRCYGYTDSDIECKFCNTRKYDREKYSSICVACWNREIPETPKAEPELTYEINLKEEKKMKNLRSLIESKVEDAIAVGKIDEYVENIVEDMDLDGDIDDLIETEIRENIDDYVGPILSEAVRDAVRNALDDLFN